MQNSMRSRIRALASLGLLICCVALPQRAVAARTTLYDGALGGTPTTQSMLLQGFGATQSFAGGLTTLDTSAANAAQAGYIPAIGSVGALQRANGYTLRFRTAVTSEVHAGSDRNSDGIDDRAGFSVIALSSDLKGIEIGFWADRVWAQADEQDGAGRLFTQAESALIDTTVLRDYQLIVRGDSYELLADGGSILSGRLRDYSSFGAPYTVASFIFLGDDTSSARAVVQIGYVDVSIYDQRVGLPLVVRAQ
jgi:hypothetical protein